MRIETPRQLGALLKDGRRRAGLTQQQLADRIQVSLRWVQRAEGGHGGTAIGKLLQALFMAGVFLDVNTKQSRLSIAVPDVNQIIARALETPMSDRRDH